MRKIRITIQKSKVRLNMAGKRKSYDSPGRVMAVLKAKLTPSSRLETKEKTALRVDYGSGYINESLPSSDRKYLLYCAKVFLEDKDEIGR